MRRAAVLAIDEGTTNSKALLISETGEIVSSGHAPVPIEHPRPGWVQQDADAIWQATESAVLTCIEGAPGWEVVALGISNQRESVLMWDRRTGQAYGPVITWQCRRTAEACDTLKRAGNEEDVIARTGLPLDPMFSATKAAWLLEHHALSSDSACIGTVDSWLIWKLTGGLHATDRSNAARTQLFNLGEQCWDRSLCDLFGIDPGLLPEVFDSSGIIGVTKDLGVIPDGIPVASAIGDSHAALFGHGAFNPGDAKVTFGTGSSIMTTIPAFAVPHDGITTTIAWSIDGKSTFAFEGNILVSASILPWTAELLGIEGVDELFGLAQSVEGTDGVSLVPAHVGLGSPHWESGVRGLVCGLSFGTGPAHLARAAVESIALQVLDVCDVISETTGKFERLFVDGGPSRNGFLMQTVANILDCPVQPHRETELSALGAGYLAGIATGVWTDPAATADLSSRAPIVTPDMDPTIRESLIGQWRTAIARTVMQQPS